MKGIDWRFLKFCLKLSIRYMPRFLVIPYVRALVGALREVWIAYAKFHAEITAYCDAERKAQQEAASSGRAVG
jgi:hypothetical protein